MVFLGNSEKGKKKDIGNYDVFNRIIECSFPKPINLFFAYHAAQTLEENVSSLYKLMMLYIGDQESDAIKKAQKKYRKALRKIKRTYNNNLNQTLKEEPIEYNISLSYDTLIQSSYTEKTFLSPKSILNLYKKYDIIDLDDLTEYKHMIEQILLNKGEFTLSDKHRKYYLKNFAKLLKTNSVNMKAYTANINTLYKVGNTLYLNDKNVLQEKIDTAISKKQDCSSATEYISLYKKILKYNKK